MPMKLTLNKIALPLAILAVILSAVTLFLSQSKSDLVYVDVNKLLEGYDRTAVERKAFEKKAAGMKANVDSLLNDWQQELKIYEKERSKMTKKELELKQELLQNKQGQVNNYQQAIQEQIKEEDQITTQTVINDINDYVKAYGKKNKHQIIFGAKGTGNIMYADEATDLTKKVLEGLNKQYNGK